MDGLEAFELGRDAFDQGFKRDEFAAYDVPEELAEDFAKGFDDMASETEQRYADKLWREANPGANLWKPWDGRL